MKQVRNRRDFLKVSAAGSLGVMALGAMACKSGTGKVAAGHEAAAAVDLKSFEIGLQLYTIRDAIAADLPGSLKRVSELGYKNLELANYADGKFYGYAPEEFKAMVEDLGMAIISSHTKVEAAGITLDNAKFMADAHAKLGVKYCIQPWVNEEERNVESYKRMIADWNKVGEIMKEFGIQFGYHNHNFEFANLDGIVPYYELFLKGLDPELVIMELDLYWASKAGQDPVELFRNYPGRFHLFHMKDMTTKGEPYYDIVKDDITSVGAGVIDFKRILAEKETAGLKYMFVEDDNQGNGHPFKGIETSITNLTSDILV